MNGDATLASAYTNTLTLNDHLVLCTGSNFTTPVDGQQGYTITGTLEADGTAITSGTATKFGTVGLTYGVWIIFNQAGYLASGSVTFSNRTISIHSTSGTANIKYGTRSNASISLGSANENHDSCSRCVTVTNGLTNYYINATLTFTGTLAMYNASTSLYAVRIA